MLTNWNSNTFWGIHTLFIWSKRRFLTHRWYSKCSAYFTLSGLTWLRLKYKQLIISDCVWRWLMFVVSSVHLSYYSFMHPSVCHWVHLVCDVICFCKSRHKLFYSGLSMRSFAEFRLIDKWSFNYDIKNTFSSCIKLRHTIKSIYYKLFTFELIRHISVSKDTTCLASARPFFVCVSLTETLVHNFCIF